MKVKLQSPVRIGLRMTRTLEFKPVSMELFAKLCEFWNSQATGTELLGQCYRAISLFTGASEGSLRRLGVDDLGLLMDTLAATMSETDNRLRAIRQQATWPEIRH